MVVKEEGYAWQGTTLSRVACRRLAIGNNPYISSMLSIPDDHGNPMAGAGQLPSVQGVAIYSLHQTKHAAGMPQG
jgi:hypothetical protein